MIEQCKSFKTSTGEIFCTLELAQKHELAQLLQSVDSPLTAADTIFANKDAVLAILGKKARKPRTAKPARTRTTQRSAHTPA